MFNVDQSNEDATILFYTDRYASIINFCIPCEVTDV